MKSIEFITYSQRQRFNESTRYPSPRMPRGCTDHEIESPVPSPISVSPADDRMTDQNAYGSLGEAQPSDKRPLAPTWHRIVSLPLMILAGIMFARGLSGLMVTPIRRHMSAAERVYKRLEHAGRCREGSRRRLAQRRK